MEFLSVAYYDIEFNFPETQAQSKDLESSRPSGKPMRLQARKLPGKPQSFPVKTDQNGIAEPIQVW